jgi:ABC-type nitrate/sulfonate/bicarbonate transport system substrate-binding protein
MATEIAVGRGVGTVVLDVRRGDGPPGCFDYTFGALATTAALVERSPETAAAAVRALVAAQTALKADVSRATSIGDKRFPPREAGLIAGIVARDLPYYDAAIGDTAIAGVNGFARDLGLLDREIARSDIVATEFAPLWQPG